MDKRSSSRASADGPAGAAPGKVLEVTKATVAVDAGVALAAPVMAAPASAVVGSTDGNASHAFTARLDVGNGVEIAGDADSYTPVGVGADPTPSKRFCRRSRSEAAGRGCAPSRTHAGGSTFRSSL